MYFGSLFVFIFTPIFPNFLVTFFSLRNFLFASNPHFHPLLDSGRLTVNVGSSRYFFSTDFPYMTSSRLASRLDYRWWGGNLAKRWSIGNLGTPVIDWESGIPSGQPGIWDWVGEKLGEYGRILYACDCNQMWACRAPNKSTPRVVSLKHSQTAKQCILMKTSPIWVRSGGGLYTAARHCVGLALPTPKLGKKKRSEMRRRWKSK